MVDIVRNGLIGVLEQSKQAVPPRIPHLTTAFIVKTTKILSNPLDAMFKSVSSFVLAKPMMDLFEVPEFLRLFHSNDVTNHSLEQEWILSVIKDGLKDELDYAIMQQNFILKMVMSFEGSSLCEFKSRSLILDIVKAVSILPSSAIDMIKNHGLLSWLGMMVDDVEHNKKISSILQSIWQSIKDKVCTYTKLIKKFDFCTCAAV